MKKAFTLIELLISLIIISLIASLLVPIITKKIKYQNLALRSGIQNCKKFDSSGRCLICDSDKCTFCSTQVGLNKGEYVEPKLSCDIKNCSEGYSKCSETSVACLEGYGYNAVNKKCTKCTNGTFSKGDKSACAACPTNSVATVGSSACIECKAIEHKKPNATKTACEDIFCSSKQYIDGISCKTCPDGTYQEANNHQQTSCLSCVEGYYCKNGQKTPCFDNCANCLSADMCVKCADGYVLSNNKCEKKSNADCYEVEYSKICIAKFNAGDPRGLEIPEGLVTMKVAIASSEPPGGQHTQAICWKGENQSACDAANGGYSGCNRTLCTWYAADKICKYHGWRLPTNDEMSSFLAYSRGKGADGIQLCDYSPGYSSARCTAKYICSGSYHNGCYPDHVWGGEHVGTFSSYTYSLDAGVWRGPVTDNVSHAFSVRCVKDL